MSEKHYPYIGGSFDRIIFDGDGSVWVPETENAKLHRAFNETLIRLVAANDVAVSNYMDDEYLELLRKLGIEVKP